MKKLIISFLILIGIYCNLTSQSLGKSGATWVYLHHNFFDGPRPIQHHYIRQVKIDSFIYDEVHHSDGHKFYFSERNNQLYFIPPGLTDERLLFNKNAGINDFWFIDPPVKGGRLCVLLVEVQDTGHIVINGISLKIWNLKYSCWDQNYTDEFYDTYIERIGSVNRYIDPYDEYYVEGADAGIGGELLCYSDDEILYERDSGTCKFLLQNIELNKSYPFVSKNYNDNTLLFLQNLDQIIYFIIYDLLGRPIHVIRNVSNQVQLNLEIQSGIVQFFFKDGTQKSLKF